MNNVKNNLNVLLHNKAVVENRVITPSEIANKIGVRPDTIQAWLKSRVVRLDVRVMKALAKYFDCNQATYNVERNELTFEGNNINE